MAIQQMLLAVGGAGTAEPGQALFTTAGSTTWTCPSGVSSISIVCIGAGQDKTTSYGQGTGGGGLGYKNNYTVTPGVSYNVQVGDASNTTLSNRDSWFNSSSTVKGGGGSHRVGNTAQNATDSQGTYTGDGGGKGGAGGAKHWVFGSGGGGGAGGYSGDGGDGGTGSSSNASTSGGNGQGYGAGGSGGATMDNSARGGGVGLEGASSGDNNGNAGTGGGGGGGAYTAGAHGSGNSYTKDSTGGFAGTTASGGPGGRFGSGGSGHNALNDVATPLPDGAVRIIWPGDERYFPTTRTTDE